MRRQIDVAAGCLINAEGEVLIAQRPVGKIAAGQWEFPGGKIEFGETALQALARELHEELGVTIRASRPLIRVQHDYSERSVLLDTWRVEAWDGTPHGRENQALAWVPPERLAEYPLLAADHPIVSALQLPRHYAFTPANMTASAMIAALPSLPTASLLRLRQPQLDDASYAALAAQLAPRCSALGLLLMLDCAPELSAEVGAAGWHASAKQLGALRERPVPATCWFAASVHDERELLQARELGVDFVVLGAICATPSHPDGVALGWSRFAELTAQASMPVFGIGGVGPKDFAQLNAAYAQGAAGISAYWSVASAGGVASPSP